MSVNHLAVDTIEYLQLKPIELNRLALNNVELPNEAFFRGVLPEFSESKSQRSWLYKHRPAVYSVSSIRPFDALTSHSYVSLGFYLPLHLYALRVNCNGAYTYMYIFYSF